MHCCSDALRLLIMSDSVNKIPALKDLLMRCKTLFTKLHFNGNVAEEEILKLHSAQAVTNLVTQVEAAFNYSTLCLIKSSHL